MDTSTSAAAKLAAELERKNPEAFQEILELMRGMIAARSGKPQRRGA